MTVDRGVTRNKIHRSARGFFIIFALTVASHGVIFASAKNTASNCGGDFSGYQYTIRSPGYPENYPGEQDCVYTLHGSQLAKCDQVYHLQFLDFALKSSENCADDYLKIGDRSLYCGSVVGIRSYPGRNNSLTLRFRSSAGSGGKGFKILVTTSPCPERQSNKQNDENFAGQRTTKENDGVATEKPDDVKSGSRNDLESFETENSYPVYRPKTDLPVEDHGRSGRQDPLPEKTEALDKNEKTAVQRDQQSVPKDLANNLELPVHLSKPFRDQTRLEIVTATPIKSEQTPKISSYLFVPPATRDESTGSGFSPRSSSTNVAKDPKSDAENFITPPPTEYLLPNRWTVNFREAPLTNLTTQLSFIQSRQRINQKFVVPARSYGVPEGPYYPPVKFFETATNTGEVLENSSETADCLGNANLEPDLEVPASFSDNAPPLIDAFGTGSPSVVGGTLGNYYPATTYGAPGSNYPRNVPNTGFDRPSLNYGPPLNYPPGTSIATGSGRPNGWIPSAGFPSSSVGARYPNFVPSLGLPSGSIYPGAVNPGTGGGYSECCSTVYSAQRSLLASPGFPSILYSGNAYDCIYTIAPYSQNTCQIRFNFRFFNHGSDDSSCSNGHVEIDGRRICGCKKNLSIVSTVTSSFPKIIGVRYTGYPRTKFNGFLIEVVQEPCSSSYPFGSRRKKDVGTTQEDFTSGLDRSSDDANSTSRRTKRNLGYSYPRPNFGLIEVPRGSQSWNSGGVVQTGIRQLSGEAGASANFFSPLLTCQALSFFDWTIAAKEAYLRGARCVRDGGTVPANPGVTFPSYPGNGGSGITFPSVPGNPGAGFPSYPVYPGNPGAALPSYPGNVGSGVTFPSYPGNPGAALPSYPGNVGSGAAFPWPNSPGSNSGYPSTGSWNYPLAKCDDVNVVEGTISSPQYPANYPPNVNKCFRFYKAPNSCQLELAILDFDLENSAGCTKDYLAFSGQSGRYCGRSLAGSKAFLDISRSNVVDIYFVSDGSGSGRGFSAGFSQIPCRGSITNH